MKINRSIFLLEKKFFLVTIMTFNEQCNNRCSLHFNTKWMCKHFYFFIFIKKSIMNFSESRQNRSRENREKSKNRFFFFPPLVPNMNLRPNRLFKKIQALCSHIEIHTTHT